MIITTLQYALLTALRDNEWHVQHDVQPPASDGVWRRLARTGRIERDVAKGTHYGVNHATRVRLRARCRSVSGRIIQCDLGTGHKGWCKASVGTGIASWPKDSEVKS